MAPSFKSVDYSIRPNKCVERRLIADAVLAIGGAYDLADYQYIGLGSMWFADFLVMHRIVGLQRLISIERESDYASRAKFNCPFHCVEVKIGSASDVLRTLDWKRRSIVWMDYDGAVDETILDDIDYLATVLVDGSFLLVSVNADNRNLAVDDTARESECRRLFGPLVQAPLPKDALKRALYPEYLAGLLLGWARDKFVTSGRTVALMPVVNVRYADNAEMVTVGGIVGEAASHQKLLKCRWPQHMGPTNHAQFRIKVPALTIREKLELDQRLPCNMDGMKNLPFRLDADQLQAYIELYRYYPFFGEMFL